MCIFWLYVAQAKADKQAESVEWAAFKQFCSDTEVRSLKSEIGATATAQHSTGQPQVSTVTDTADCNLRQSARHLKGTYKGDSFNIFFDF